MRGRTAWSAYIAVVLLAACTTRPPSAMNADPADARSAPDWEVPPVAPNCRHPAPDYAVAPIAACTARSFVCPPDHAVFVDDCGCGCTIPAFILYASNVPFGGPGRQACNGPSGQLAWFDADITQFSIGTDRVYAWIGRSSSLWTIDKSTRAVTLLADIDAGVPENAPGAVTWRAYSDTFDAGGFKYWNDGAGLARSPLAGGPMERLFLMPDSNGDQAFVVAGNDFYATDASGTLWYADLSISPTEPAVVEQRGPYDDDDYVGLMGIDADAVYWHAGVLSGRTSDSDGLALFRTCRPAR